MSGCSVSCIRSCGGSPLVFFTTNGFTTRLNQARSSMNSAFGFSVRNIAYRDRAHFFAIAAQTMRRILIDYARSSHG